MTPIDTEFLIISKITFAIALLSLWGSSLIINAWSIFGKGRGFSAMVVLLALGDFLWSISAVTSSAILLWDPQRNTYPVCLALRFMYQWGAWSSLCWSIAILVFILLGMNDVKNNTPERSSSIVSKTIWWGFFLLLAYGYMIISTAVLMGAGLMDSTKQFHCHPKHPYQIYLWFAPLMVLFVSAIILFGCVIYVYRRAKKMHVNPLLGRSVTLSVPFRTALFPLVMLVTWSLNIVANLMPEGAAPFGLIVAYTVMLNTQGFWDAIVYGVTNGRFRDFFRKRVFRTVILFLFGPVVVVPLFLRRMFLFVSQKWCSAEQEIVPDSPSEVDPFLYSSNQDSGSSIMINSESKSKTSLFPLSSSTNPIPDMGYATSFTAISDEPKQASVPKYGEMDSEESSDDDIDPAAYKFFY